MPTLAQRWVEQGEQKGIQKGRVEGLLETAKKMKKDNLPIEMILKYTGLSSKEIEALTLEDMDDIAGSTEN